MIRHVVYISIALNVLLSACGSGLSTPKTAKLCDRSITFDKDISAILASSGTGHCGTCHAGRYDNKSGIQNNRAKVYARVDDGTMPQDSAGFKESADGQKFLGWAACSKLN